MRPEGSVEFELDQSSEDIAIAIDEEVGDIVEASAREHRETLKVDADFFNSFEDDFDESDMKPSTH